MALHLRFGGYQGPGSVHTRAGRVFAEALERLTGGEAVVSFEENIVAQGHKAADLLAMTEAGTLDGCYFSSSYLADRVPELAVFDQHFAVPGRAHAYAMLDGELGRHLAERVAARTGFAVLAYWDNGLRHISCARGPLRRPQDCRGLRLRTLASDDHRRVFRALGFEPVAIDVRDLPAAVASGRVDAQENPLTNIWNFRLHEAHRFITLTGHLLGVAPVLFNAAAVAGWPEDLRRAVEDALAEATAAQRRLAAEDDVLCARALADEGVTLVELTEAERAAFAAAARPEVEVTRRRFAPELLELFDRHLRESAP